MTSVCKNCGKTVIPDPNDAHCPNCDAKKGYTVTKTVTFRHRIEDERDEIKRTIDEKFKEYDKYIKQGKNVEFFKSLKKSLEKQVPEFLEQTEKNAEQRLEQEAKGRQQQVSHTTDSLIGTEEQRKIKEQEDYIEKLEKENSNLRGQLEANNFVIHGMNENIENILISTNNLDKKSWSTKKMILLTVGLGIIAGYLANIIFGSFRP